MIMDRSHPELPVLLNGWRLGDFFPDAVAMNGAGGLKSQVPQALLAPNNNNNNNNNNNQNNNNNHVGVVGFPYVPPPGPQFHGNPAGASFSAEDSEVLSDMSLNYISRMLLEEDIDEKVSMYQEESAALRAAARPFYDILGQTYPPSPDQPPLYSSYSWESTDDSGNGHYGNSHCAGGFDSFAYQQHRVDPASVCYSTQSLFTSSNSILNFVDSLEEPLFRTPAAPDLFVDSQSAWQFRRGVEDAQKFLPSNDKLVIGLEANGLSSAQDQNVESDFVEFKAEEEDREYQINGSRGRKNPYRDDLDLEEGRSSKQSAISSEDVLRSDMFDFVLLSQEGKCQAMNALRRSLQKEASKNIQNDHFKGSNGRKARGRKQSTKEVVDLRTLLIHCAQSVAADDRRSASELLKQIRQHSSPFGDGTQRLAHCFADGLEARLAGTGSRIYHSLVAKRMIASDILKAYRLYLAASPFKRISHFVANQTILNLAEKASRLHIVDFGIYFGFQWPGLFQRLADRTGGPPKLRITGIDVPQPGFRPTERIEETGRRLADYAKTFNVPFEYHPIASKWEAIRVEDLNIDKDEVLIVNCLYRFRNLVDETVVVDSPRNKVLKTIRKMNPHVFIHGIINGSYSAPFFVTRFREALFHFSALFDMLETNVPREDAQRLLIERDLFGREALNVIACEGSERVERPETYKQWQMRNLRAGFEQVLLNPELTKQAMAMVKRSYHKDFVIDVDCKWLLQGWKGRIVYALSTWKPNNAH